MQVIFRCCGQRPRLERWEERDFWPGVEQGPRARDHRDHYEREVAVEEAGDPEPDGPYRRVARAILRYEVFPPSLVRGVLRRATVDVGDTVGICYHFLRGIDLFFGARVVDRFDHGIAEVWKSGFTYRTLRGHAEMGEETFSVEKHVGSGRVMVALRSWSRPRTLLARGFAPWVRRMQVRACHAALDQLQQVARGGSEEFASASILGR